MYEHEHDYEYEYEYDYEHEHDYEHDYEYDDEHEYEHEQEWGGEKSEVFHLVMLFISVPQVTHCTGTVDVLTAKRLYPGAQGRRRAPLRSSGRRRTPGFRAAHHASVEP